MREKHNLKVLKDLVFRKCEEMIVLSAATARSKVSGWGAYCEASSGFLLLPVAPSVSCSSVDTLHTRSSNLPPSSTVSRCLSMSTTRLSLLPDPNPKWRAEIVRALREMMVDEASAETPSEIGCGHEHEQEDERESEREHEPEHEGDHEGDHEQEDEREGEREREHECERDHEQEDEHVRVEHDEHEHEHKYKCAVGRPPPILIGTNTTSTRKWAQPPPTPRGCLGRGA